MLRGDGQNLKDIRVAYTLLISLAVICTVLGTVAVTRDERLHDYELRDCYRSFRLCSDSISEWMYAADESERYAAGIRFDEAVSTLPEDVDIAPLKQLAGGMLYGGCTDAQIRAYFETFSLLAALDYEDKESAEFTASETLDAVAETFSLSVSEETEKDVLAVLPPETLRFSKDIAKHSVRSIFKGGAGAVEPALSEDGREWLVETSNLRISFSSTDGRIESFVCIHVGHTPTDVLTGEERLSSALDFLNENRRTDNGRILSAEDFCGFLAVDLEADGEYYRAAVDSAGRVWSLTKVKR